MKKINKSSKSSSPKLPKLSKTRSAPSTIKSKKDLKSIKSEKLTKSTKSIKSEKQIKTIKEIKKTDLKKKTEIIRPLIDSYESKRELLRKYLINKDDKNIYNVKKKSTKERFVELIKKDNSGGFMVIERFLFVFGLLYFVLAIVALIFYSNKQALFLVGLPSTLHIFRLYLLEFNRKLIRLNTSLINILINLIWLISILTIIILFLIKDNNEEIKIEFRNEIILHVGLFFYSPLVFLSLINSLVLYSKRIDFLELYHELNKPEECSN